MVELKEIRNGVEFLFKDGTGNVNTGVKTAIVKWAEAMGKNVDVFKQSQKVIEEEERQQKLKEEAAAPAPVLPYIRTTSLFLHGLASRSQVTVTPPALTMYDSR